VSDENDERDPTNWESPTPIGSIEGTGRNEGNAIQFSWWNLLLLVPLLMLITPIYNTDEPALLGMPYFYWYQFMFVFVGVACVAVVFATTRHRGRARAGRSADKPSTQSGGDAEAGR